MKIARFIVDWIDFRRMLRASILDGKQPELKHKVNRDRFMDDVTSAGEWKDFSKVELKSWVADGFWPSNTLAGMDGLLPPVTKKRLHRFVEDGDEFHVDRALSGDDFFMSEMTYEKSIPGVTIEAGIMFSGSTSGRVVNQYTIWLAKALYSLESAGISAELTLNFPSWNCMEPLSGGGRRIEAGSGTLYDQIVRVSKSSEKADFNSWSAMVSPAALRNFGFGLITMHADEIGMKAVSSMGRGVPERKDWKVILDEERKALVVENNYMGPRDFPEYEMTEQLIAAVHKLRDM